MVMPTGNRRGGLYQGYHGDNAQPWADDVTLVASAARTASGNSGDLTGYAPFTSACFVLEVTAAATAAGDTLNVYVQRKLPNGDYDDIVAFTQVLGDGGAKVYRADVYSGASAGGEEAPKDGTLTAGTSADLMWGNTLRVKWVIVDATTDDASFTFSVHGNFKV